MQYIFLCQLHSNIIIIAINLDETHYLKFTAKFYFKYIDNQAYYLIHINNSVGPHYNLKLESNYNFCFLKRVFETTFYFFPMCII